MKAFFLSRFRGDAPLQTVFWRDMVIVGTGANIIAGAIMLILIAAEASSHTTMLAYLAPLPLNLFLFYAVWRASDRVERTIGTTVKMCGAGWLALMLII